MDYLIYEIATGRVTQRCTTPDPSEIDPILQPGQAYVPRPSNVDDVRYYVPNGVVIPRPEQPTKLTGQKLTRIPGKSTVHINGQAYECDDSTIELEFDQPGIYNVRVECWPYLDKEFTVEAETL